MGEGQGAVPGEVCVRRDINNVLVGPRGRAPRKNRLVKGKSFLPPSLPVPSREVQALLERQLREQSLQAETGLLQKGRQHITTVSVRARERKSYRPHASLCSGAALAYAVKTAPWTSRQDRSPFTLGIVFFQKASPL